MLEHVKSPFFVNQRVTGSSLVGEARMTHVSDYLVIEIQILGDI